VRPTTKAKKLKVAMTKLAGLTLSIDPRKALIERNANENAAQQKTLSMREVPCRSGSLTVDEKGRSASASSARRSGRRRREQSRGSRFLGKRTAAPRLALRLPSGTSDPLRGRWRAERAAAPGVTSEPHAAGTPCQSLPNSRMYASTSLAYNSFPWFENSIPMLESATIPLLRNRTGGPSPIVTIAPASSTNVEIGAISHTFSEPALGTLI